MLNVYKKYPFPVPQRTKMINLFRYVFTFRLTEKILLYGLKGNNHSFWRKCVPPIYFYHRNDIREVERNGIRYSLMLCDLIDYQIFFDIKNDPGTTNLFNLVKSDYHVIDLGSNIGSYSLQFARMASKGMVYAFEPSQFNLRRLEKNISLNSFNNIRTYNVALGENAANAELSVINPYNLGMNRITKVPGKYSSENILVTTLDFLDAQNTFEKADLVKIDTEGFELKVLRGAWKFLQRWKPVLFIELIDFNLMQQDDSASALIEFVQKAGYSVLDAKTMKAIEPGILYTDIICFPVKS